MTTIEPWLREILRCPACHSALRDQTGETGATLVCTDTAGASCGLVYRVDDGIPVLLVDEATKPGADGPDTSAPDDSTTDPTGRD